VKKLLRKRKMK